MAVLGAGAWGTALAAILAQREPVTLVCHSPETAARIRDTGRNEARLPGIDLPDGIRATDEPAALAEATDLVVVAVPSTHVRQTLGRAAAHIPAVADVLSVVKGIERETHLRMTQVIAEAASIDPRRVAALSGPNLALEIARRLPASAVVAAEDVALAARIQERLGRRRFRLYVNRDVLGVELCGALKNIVAIAAGAAEALGFGDNGKAGLMTRGLAEMTRVGHRSRREPADVRGPGRHRRRRRHVRLAAVAQPSPGRWSSRGAGTGRTSRPPAGRRRGRVHGGRRARARRRAWASRCRSPSEVHRALFEGKSVQRCLIDLLARESKDELADLRSLGRAPDHASGRRPARLR